ncbi:MAG: hypothetical protein GF308_20035 [Candidatus Heimdallarchaeota archaeon]|nr:hypothetical protein [Candidatus Heimdallarchaeota archaeon]
MKTISIDDELYEKLSQLKGDSSWSELLKELLRSQVQHRAAALLRGAKTTGYEDELLEIAEAIRAGFQVRT